MTRAFPKSVILAAWERCGGICECGCGKPIYTAPEHDHYPVPFAFGGPSTLENCRVLRKQCHREITAKVDIPRIAKAQRILEKRAGARKTSRPFPRRVDPWRKNA